MPWHESFDCPTRAGNSQAFALVPLRPGLWRNSSVARSARMRVRDLGKISELTRRRAQSRLWPVAPVSVLAQLVGILSAMRDFQGSRQILRQKGSVELQISGRRRDSTIREFFLGLSMNIDPWLISCRCSRIGKDIFLPPSVGLPYHAHPSHADVVRTKLMRKP